MLRNAKLNYCAKINAKDQYDLSVKQIFSQKINTIPSLNLVEENKVIHDGQTIAENLNEHFVDITDNLGIMQYDNHLPVAMIKSYPDENV